MLTCFAYQRFADKHDVFTALAACRHHTDTQAHRLPTYAAAAAGVLLVGLIHARLWRTDPWGRTRERTLPEGRQA
ncbi:hypothetical protein [Streptomyces sp. NPDC096013]|uniref:hypothetical protein n=1 Tax=Streptomyces sp. NPDC096013 TaxID=3366069 RepID=UPI0037F1195D